MIAYHIHWRYPASADDANYYGGTDDYKLFHNKENAEKYAKEQLKQWQNNEISSIYDEDLPCDYTIREREIKFEDE